MITATVSLPTTTITPVVDGAVTTALTTTTPAPLSEGFSNALTAQLNLLAQPVVADATTLASTPATISAAIAASSTTPTPIATELLTNATMPEMAASSTTNGALVNATVTANLAATANTLPNVAAATMSAEDTAILSAVTGTLKFTTPGSKLGDTLPAGQTVQLSTSNSATALTQQSIQAAVKQAVLNTQVSTPASVLAQQITPVQVGQTSETTAAQTVVTSQAQIVNPQIQVQTMASTQTSDVNASLTPAQIQAQTQAQTAENTPSDVNTSLTPAQIQVQTTASMQTFSDASLTPAQIQAQTVANTQTSNVNASLTPPAQTQTGTNTQTSDVNATLTPAQIQAQTQTVANTQTPDVNASLTSAQIQAQTVANTRTPDVNASLTPAQAQTVATSSTQTLVSSVSVTTQAPADSTQQPASTVQTLATVQSEIPENVVTTSDSSQSTVTEQMPQDDVVVQAQQNNAPKIANQTPVVTDNATTPQLAVTAPLLPATQGISIKAKNGDNSTPVATSDVEHKTAENQDTPVVQVVPDIMVAPQVTAQAAPPVQTKTENVSGETTGDTTQDKPTLTSAKTLLMDAVANRNSSGDAANNSNNGNNAPSNPALQGDALLNQQPDNKQNADTKTFANLLNTEKTDTLSASATAPTSDKSAPQNVSAAVNKLVQDTKVDVPAMTKPLSHPEWNQDLGERIVWMNNKGVSSAEIKMNPPNMGPISVRIDMNQDQATIAFTAQNSDVRNALEASVPKLREMLSSQHVNLAEVNVSQQSSTSTDSGRSQQQFAQMADASTNSGQGNRQNNPEFDAQGNPINVGNSVDGTVDEFANGQVISSNGTNGLLSIYA